VSTWLSMSGSSGENRLTILVPDPQSPGGGVETMNCALLPRFARMGCRIIWMMPSHRQGALETRFPAGLQPELVEAEWPVQRPERWLAALARRISNSTRNPAGATFGKALSARLEARRIRHLARQRRPDWLLYPWILRQPIPRLGVPVACVALDRNW